MNCGRVSRAYNARVALARILKQPTEASRNHLRQLKTALKPAGLFRAERDPGPHITVLIEAGEPGVLRDLIAIALEADPQKRAGCVSAISAIAAPLLPDRLPEWDEWVRRSWSVLEEPGDVWGKLNKQVIEQLPLTMPDNIVLLGLCASHGNGYIREAAVVRLTQVQNGSELGFLILRANDWVSAIQMRVRTALMDRLTASYANTFVRHLILLDYLARAKRFDHGPLLNAIERFIRSAEARPALLTGLESPQYPIRRRCYELVYAAHGPAPEWLGEKAMADPDVVIRYRAYAQVLTANEALPMTVVRRAAKDSFPPIRGMAFDCVQKGVAARELIQGFLFDRSTELRQGAQRYWRDLKFGNPADTYRESLQQSSSEAVAQALSGLGETGQVADADLVLPFLRHRLAAVRRAAVRAICRLQPPNFLDIVTQTLLTDSPSVAAAAGGCLEKHVRHMNPSPLWDRAVIVGTIHSQICVIRIFRQLSKWERLEHLLRAILTSEAARTFAIAELGDWNSRFNRTFTTLTPAQHSTLRSLLVQARALLSSEMLTEIEFVLRAG